MNRGARTALAGLLACGVISATATWAIADRPILDRRWWIVGLLAVAVGAWLGGSWCALRLPTRPALLVVATLAVALRLAALTGPPPMSDDVYRYGWDAKVQLAGRSPYTHPPNDTELAHLRDSYLWPGPEECAELDRPPGCTRINRPAEPTVYPPAAQAWFLIVRALTAGAEGERPWQAAAMIVDLGLCALLAWGLRDGGRDPRLVCLWALSPLAIVEVVLNAHMEGLVALCCVAALIAARRRRDGPAGGLIGVAAMMKLYPAVLLLPVGRRRPTIALGAFTAVVAAMYLPHVLTAGFDVLGYLPGYLREERYDSGDRFLLLRLVGLGGGAGPAVAVLIMSVTAIWIWRRRQPIEQAACVTVAVLFLTLTPVQPWYAVSLAAIGVLAGQWRWSLVAIAGWPYYAAVILDHPRASTIGTVSYALAAAAIAAGYWFPRALAGRRRDRSQLARPRIRCDEEASLGYTTSSATGRDGHEHGRPIAQGPLAGN